MNKMDNLRLPYLSPTSYQLYRKDLREFYRSYLARIRAPRFPQTQPMSIGSAFDAYVKSFLANQLGVKDEKLKFSYLFNAQVEEHNREWAKEEGKKLFDNYFASGAIQDLLYEMNGSLGAPRFEFDIKQTVTRGLGVGPILLGKPDIFFINSSGAPVLLDLKVNGYCSKSKTSPAKGYVKCRELKNNLFFNTQHKDFIPVKYKGITINGSLYLEQVNESWAIQLSIYSWLLGQSVGAEIITGIEQVVNRDRFCSHRLRISQKFQEDLFNDLTKCWEIINSDWIFRDLSFEDSQKLCEQLDTESEALWKDGPDKVFAELTRE